MGLRNVLRSIINPGHVFSKSDASENPKTMKQTSSAEKERIALATSERLKENQVQAKKGMQGREITVQTLKTAKASEEGLSFPTTDEAKKKLAERFKPGDIVMTKYTGYGSGDFLDPAITIVQKVSNFFRFITGAKQKNYERMTHAAIVVGTDPEKGRVYLAEAMPTGKGNELRITDLLSDKSLILDKRSPYEYQVVRMNPSHIRAAKTAAEIAASLATPSSYLANQEEFQKAMPEKKAAEKALPSSHKFSIIKGLKAIFSSPKMTEATTKQASRVFKQIADEYLRREQKRDRATGGDKDRSFFCSYFTSHVLRQAVLAENLDLIIDRVGAKAELERIAKLPQTEQNHAIQNFAKKMARNHKDTIVDYLGRFDIDPKKTSPQAFRSHLEKIGASVDMKLVPPG